jgi:hypothetical protein
MGSGNDDRERISTCQRGIHWRRVGIDLETGRATWVLRVDGDHTRRPARAVADLRRDGRRVCRRADPGRRRHAVDARARHAHAGDVRALAGYEFGDRRRDWPYHRVGTCGASRSLGPGHAGVSRRAGASSSTSATAAACRPAKAGEASGPARPRDEALPYASAPAANREAVRSGARLAGRRARARTGERGYGDGHGSDDSWSGEKGQHGPVRVHRALPVDGMQRLEHGGGAGGAVSSRATFTLASDEARARRLRGARVAPMSSGARKLRRSAGSVSRGRIG